MRQRSILVIVVIYLVQASVPSDVASQTSHRLSGSEFQIFAVQSAHQMMLGDTLTIYVEMFVTPETARRGVLLARAMNRMQFSDALTSITLVHSSLVQSRQASDIAWSEFLSTLEYVCMKRGVLLKKVDPKNTSRECSGCGCINKELQVADRTWICTGCGVEHDRDVNAGINILQRAFCSQRGDVSGDGEANSLRVAVAA